MSDEFVDLDALFENDGDNPAFSDQGKENLNRNADLKKYEDFLTKSSLSRGNIPRDVKELKRHLVNSIFTAVFNSPYREKLGHVPGKVLVKIAKPFFQPLWNYTAIYKGIYDEAEKQYRDIVTGKKAYTPYDDFFDKFNKIYSWHTRLWVNSIEAGAKQVKEYIDSAPKQSPAPSAPSPSPAPSAPSAPSPSPAPSAPSAPSPSPAPSTPSAPSPSPAPSTLDQIWGKHKSFLLATVEQDVTGGRDAQQSLADALQYLKVKVSGEDFGELFKRIANELGLVIEKEKKETEEAVEKSGSEAKEEAKARSKSKLELIKGFFEQFRKLGTGLNPYTEARASYYINKNVDGRALEAVSTYNSIIQEFPNISLEAVSKVARERRMFFHPAYIQALYETNPSLSFQRKRSGQEYIDFHALSADLASDGTLDLKVAAENAKAQVKRTSSKGRKTTPLDILKSFGRGGFFGAFESLGRYLFSNAEEERIQPVSSEEVANIIESARQDIERATLEDGSIDLKKLADPNVFRLVSSSDYINTAYKIALERRRSQASSVEPGSALNLPRRTKKPWRRPEIPFRKIKDGFSFAFGATKSGAHRVFDPAFKAAGSAWQAVKDDFNGVWGIDDEEFNRIVKEKEKELSPAPSPTTSFDDELTTLIEERAKLSQKQVASVFEDNAPEFTKEDADRLVELDDLISEIKAREAKDGRKEYREFKKRSRKRAKFEKWKKRYEEKKSRESASAPQAPEPSPATSPKKPKWKVEATDAAGNPFTDVVEGDTIDEVVAEFESLGYTVEKIDPAKERKPAKPRKATGGPAPSGSGDSSGGYELDPDGFTFHYKTKSDPDSPAGPSSPSGSAPGGSGGAAVLARVFGLISALATLIVVVNKVKQKLDQMSSATHSFNDKFSQYNATISGYKLQQDAAAFKRDVKTAAEAANPYADGTTPQGLMTKASIEWEDSKAGLASAWNRKMSPLKSWTLEGFSNLNEDLTTILNPKGVGDFFSALAGPWLGNGSHDPVKEKIAFGIDKVIEKLTGIEGFAKESAKDRKEEKEAQSGGIKASALLRAIETMGDLKATSGFMQTNSPSNNWTVDLKTEGQYGRDASSPSKKYGSGLTYHTRKE